jgi:imidazolonepropionase-like amidohydrolase
MNRLICLATAAGFCFLLFACTTNFPRAAGLVVSNVTVISPERTGPLTYADVRILDGRIVEVGNHRLRGETEIDGTGRFLIPGLIDSHVHLAVAPQGFPAPMTLEQAAANPKVVAAALAQDPKSYLFFGFTTVVDLYGAAERTAHWNQLNVRPDAYFCGGMSIYKGHFYRILGPVFSYDRALILDPKQRTPEEAAAAIKADGAVCLKTGSNPGDDITVEQGRALVEAAHAVGLPVFFHANAKETQAYAVAIGVDVIAHGMWNGHTNQNGVLEDDAREILAKVIRDKIGYQPTIQVLFGELDLFHSDYLATPELADVYPGALIDWYAHAENPFADRIRGAFRDRKLDADAEYAKTIGWDSQATRMLAEADARILFGTDTPSAWTYANPPGVNARHEMDNWIAAGVSRKKLFNALTIDNARALRLEREIGTVEPGKRANLLLLGGNPLERLDAYDTVQTVFLHGRPIPRASLSARNAPAKMN